MVKHWPASLRQVTAHDKRPAIGGILGFEHVPFIALWAFALQRCIQSAGVPYEAALEHHKQAVRQEQALPLEDVQDEWHMPDTPTSDVDQEEQAGSFEATNATEEDKASEEMPLPNPYLPAFWDCLILVGVFLAHVLLMFIQRWLIGVRVAIRYSRRSTLKEGSFAFIRPHPHQGEPDVVPVKKSKAGDVEVLYFIFQRQRFEVDENEQSVHELESPTNLQLKEYVQSKGLEHESEVQAKQERYGGNDVSIPLPTFKDIYTKQILGPVPVFQIFCTLLWLLDEYWKYAIFNIGSILVFEGSTAFGRLKNISTLRQMGSKKSNVHVFRQGSWQEMSSDKLLPGDIFELTKTNEDVTVPCDSLLLNGAAVMNEATLTGESTPQMKEAVFVDSDNEDEHLDMNSKHKVHVLFAGTSLLQHTPGTVSQEFEATSLAPPNGGVVCYALRTGFQSAQGKLVRMIEYSSEQVMSDTKETLALLLLLLLFALCSSGYVLYKGLQEQRRSQYELVLRCVLILTSVVPPELPMQTAVAVNTAILSLWRSQVFCTEPFRVPYGGRVDYCLFDKTGTLTSDQLETVGALPAEKLQPRKSEGKVQVYSKQDASWPLQVVIAGCHSIVEVGGKHVGDPVETAALHWISWDLDASSGTATPGSESNLNGKNSRVKVLHRFHFSSKLQRMSAFARISEGNASAIWVLCKGSPEALQERMASIPEGYERTYRGMSERGMRVLALAYRRLSDSEGQRAENMAKRGKGYSREEAESELHFAGFIAFSCRERKDTREVIQNLIHGSHNVAMATGDNVLTALYVADQVALTGQGKRNKGPLVLDEEEAAEENNKKLVWRPARDDDAERLLPCDFTPESLKQLSDWGHDLTMTGYTFRRAVEQDPATWNFIDRVKVFARMSPDNKELLMRTLKERGRHTLMCGDGANDVGALKQAHVGVALLSGFASANTARDGEKRPEEMTDDERKKVKQQEHQKMSEMRKQAAEEQRELQRELKQLQQQYFNEEQRRLAERGDQGIGAQFRATRGAMSRLMQYQKQRTAEIKRKYGAAAAGGGNLAQQAAAMAQDTDTGEMPMVKLGDASIAAPFTSKLPSIRSTADIIRQGRCTLVSTIQQQQILALNCLIAAYSLSALYLDGVKSSEPQMIASGALLTVASLAFSYAKSVDELSPVRPIASIFHPAISLSILGQLAIHLLSMVSAIRLAKEHAPEEVEALAELSYAKPKHHAPPPAPSPPAEEEDTLLALLGAGSSNFTPSLLNTVVFLIETAQQVSVMMVNYKGRPFMISSLENRPMLYSLAACCALTFACAFEAVPWLNSKLQLVSLPSSSFRTRMLLILSASVFGSLLWDRLCSFFFARNLLITGHRDAFNALPSFRENLRFWAKCGYVGLFAGAYVLAKGNALVPLGGYLIWRRLRLGQRLDALQ